MTVKEIIITACEMLEQNELAEKLQGGLELIEEETLVLNQLIKAYNFIQNELATEFVPLIHKESIGSKEGCFSLSKLEKRLAYIVSFKDGYAQNLKYKIIGDKLIFEGKGELTYCYCPEKATIDDESLLLVPERVVAYGILREYFLLNTCPSEASHYETKFKNSLFNFSRKKSEIVMPSHIWK